MLISRPSPAGATQANPRQPLNPPENRENTAEIFFESFSEHTWDEAESCLSVLRNRRVEQELSELQQQLEAKPAAEELRRIITRRLELQKLLAGQ